MKFLKESKQISKQMSKQMSKRIPERMSEQKSVIISYDQSLNNPLYKFCKTEVEPKYYSVNFGMGCEFYEGIYLKNLLIKANSRLEAIIAWRELIKSKCPLWSEIDILRDVINMFGYHFEYPMETEPDEEPEDRNNRVKIAIRLEDEMYRLVNNKILEKFIDYSFTNHVLYFREVDGKLLK